MTKQLIAVLFAVASIGANAQATNDSSNTSEKTRAEVLADLEAYQMAGLHYFDRLESPAYGSPAYAAAVKRYNEIRNSPKFAKMIQAHTAKTGEQTELARAQSEQTKQQ